MDDLFVTSFPGYYGQPARDIDAFLSTTNEIYFEIEDRKEQLQFHIHVGDGTARFDNPDAINLVIFNYEGYINGFSPRFQQGRRRCDFIMASETARYFILGEMKSRNPFHDVAQGARGQLLGSLVTIYNVPEINAYIHSKMEKKCCYFNKQPQAPPEIDAPIAFGLVNELLKYGFEMPYPEINQYGFSYFEFYGTQTMRLTA